MAIRLLVSQLESDIKNLPQTLDDGVSKTVIKTMLKYLLTASTIKRVLKVGMSEGFLKFASELVERFQKIESTTGCTSWIQHCLITYVAERNTAEKNEQGQILADLYQ